MRIPAGTLAFLLLTLPCIAQQSAQSSDQNQKPSQSQDQSQSQNQTGDNSQSQQPPARRPSTAEENPFPEDISRKAAAAAGNSTPDTPTPNDAAPPAPSSGSNSPPRPAEHPAPGSSSSRTGLRSLDDVDTAESRISDGAGGYIYSPKLAAQDVKVGGFYFGNGDYKGAYSRFKEATKVDPGNAEAVFGLAEAARALKLNSEAVDNYRIYLDAVPNGSKAKVARKALAALGESPKK